MQDAPLAGRVLRHLRDPAFRPQTATELACLLCSDPAQHQEFHRTLEKLRVRGRVFLNGRGQVVPVSPTGTMTGIYRANARGFGFCIPDHPTEYGDLFIPPGRQADALAGDHVLVRVLKRGKRHGRLAYEGRVVEVLGRHRGQFVGALQSHGQEWFILADGAGVPGRILVADAPASGAREGDQVVVQLVQYPDRLTEARGVVIEILGPHGAPGVDALSILREHEIPDTFDEACLDQARRAALDFEPGAATAGRADLRDTVILTIDPHDARDFDDAISVSRVDNGWELGVHIADVSHFVPPDSPLDREARDRGNSVYLPAHVVPMLPESLSNGVCSLQEGVPRLAKTAFIQYDDQGTVVSERFCNSVIQSRKRLTYEQAATVLEGRRGGVSEEIQQLLQRMNELARVIEGRRRRAGMVSLTLDDAELVLDDNGDVTEVRAEDHSYPHTIIEMFMVEANDAVARRLNELGIVALRRVHPDPSPDAARRLEAQLGVLGFEAPSDMDRHGLQALLEKALDGPEAFNVNYAVLRSMAPATYSPEPIGHYALASEHYAHFTSPIRRYPDLTVHRALDAIFVDPASGPQMNDPAAYARAVELGAHCSEMERRAEEAERDLRLVKLLRYLEGRLGTDERGVVTGLAEVGLFVRLDRYFVDGLVRFEDMSQQPWEVLRDSFCAVHLSSGRRITIGDVVKVRLAAVDVAARRLDLALRDQITSRGRGVPAGEKKTRQTRTGSKRGSTGPKAGKASGKSRRGADLRRSRRGRRGRR